jgi:hypothetical protein
MRSKCLPALRTEQHPHLAAVADIVVPDQVVRVAVPNRDAMGAAAIDEVLLRQPVLDAPAEEQSDIAPLELVAADDRPLRSGTGVQSEAGARTAAVKAQ